MKLIKRQIWISDIGHDRLSIVIFYVHYCSLICLLPSDQENLIDNPLYLYDNCFAALN